jgi:hypothetical protein
VSRIATNDAYAWTGHGNGTTASTADGLNQIAAHGGTVKGKLLYDPLGRIFET